MLVGFCRAFEKDLGNPVHAKYAITIDIAFQGQPVQTAVLGLEKEKPFSRAHENGYQEKICFADA